MRRAWTVLLCWSMAAMGQETVDGGSIGVPPTILSTPNPFGAVGVPYRVTFSGLLEARGDGPIHWSSCAAPNVDFAISVTGRVKWTPLEAGLYQFCARATNAAGVSEQGWTVSVAPEAAGVDAALSVSPAEGKAPLAVTLSAQESLHSGAVLGYRWWFGDGSRAETEGPTVQHTYALPGGYRPRVTVVDAQGTEATADARVSVFAMDGRAPPIAAISPQVVHAVGETTVTFSCACEHGPFLSYQWDTSDGRGAGETKTHTFGPGRYWVTLHVVNEEGLTAMDTAEVVVTSEGGAEPPHCAPSISPAAGVAPLEVTHRAFARPANALLTGIEWSLGGAVREGDEVQHTYSAFGWNAAKVHVTDAEGLSCRGGAAVAVTALEGQLPPAILEPTASASVVCGQPLSYTAAAVIPEEHTWGVENAPDGMAIDPATGVLSWTAQPWQAGKDGGVYAVSVTLSSGEAVARQTLNLEVTCASANLRTSGCAATGAATPILAGLLLLLGCAVRRRWP